MAKQVRITKEFGKRLPRLGSQEGTVLLGDVFEGIVEDIDGIHPRLGDDAEDFDLELLLKDTSRVCPDGIIQGIYGVDPKIASSQAPGAGDTEWLIDVTGGFASIQNVDKFVSAVVDYVVHTGSSLLSNGENVAAMLIAKHTPTGPEIDSLVGTPFAGTINDHIDNHRKAAKWGYLFDGNTDFVGNSVLSRVQSFWSDIESLTGFSRYEDATKKNYNWIYVSYLILERTADTTVSQEQINNGRDIMGRSQREVSLLRRALDASIRANDYDMNVKNI